MCSTLNKVLIYFALIFVLLKLVTGNVVFVGIAGALIFLCFLITFRWFKLAPIVIFTLVLVYILWMGLISVDVEGRNYFLYVFYFTFSIMLTLCIRHYKIDYKLSLSLLLVSCLWMIFQIYKFGYNPDAYNDLIDGSRNYISAYLILFYIYYLYACYVNNRQPNLIFPLFIVVACVYLYGRSGIILSVLLLLISVLQTKSRIKIGLFMLLGLLTLIFYYNTIYNIILNSNLSHGVETERSGMLMQYVGSIQSARDLILGVDLFQCCSLIIKFEGNPHNSFVMMHSRFGIFPFIIIVFFYLYQITARLFLKKWYLNLLLLMIFMRYFLDTLGFFGPVDFILFAVILSIISNDNVIKSEHPQSHV